MRHLARALAACTILAGAAACHPKHAHAATPLLGLYEGNGCNIAAQNAAARNMLGRVEDLDTVFIDYSQTPEYAYTNVDYGLGCYQGQVANVALSVPLAFTRASGGGYGLTAGAYTLEDVLAGKLDAVFAHFAQSAVAHGFRQAFMRLGWEMNGNWYLWAAQGRTATFDAAACHVEQVMEAAAPTANFSFVLNPTTNADASNEYPPCNLDVAWDQYENFWTVHAAPIGAPAFAMARDSWWGFDSMPGWYGASRHEAPEVGVGYQAAANAPTTADDPVFMHDLIAYDVAQNVVYMGFWDSNASYPGRFSDGSHPGEALEVMKEWGSVASTLAGSSLYTGTAFKAAPPAGYHAFLAQLTNGDVEQLAWGDQVGQTIQATDLTAPPIPPAIKATGIGQGQTITVTPNADGSGHIHEAFPTTASTVNYVTYLSSGRVMSFCDATGHPTGYPWQGGADMTGVGWSANGGTGDFCYVPK